MGKWLCAAAAAIGIAVYLLYRRGAVVSKCIAAVLFVFRPGASSDRVSLDSCTGWVRHVGQFLENRTYEFALDARLSKGDVQVAVLDREKRQLLKLDRRSPVGELALDRENRYYLRWDFESATGRCELRW